MTTTPTEPGSFARATTAGGELAAIGMDFPRWQDAVEAVIGTDRLAVTGEVRGGQLIQYADPSGAQLTILAVEPYATFIGFRAVTQNFANVSMLNDVLALIDIIDPYGEPVASVTANLAQGPLLVDAETQPWQQVGLAVMGLDVQMYSSADAFTERTGKEPAAISSPGADLINSGSGAQAPTPAFDFTARVMEAEWQRNELTGQRFVHVIADGGIPFDLCLPESFGDLPEKGAILHGRGMLTASITAPTGGGCGCGSGGCGCGGH